MPDLPLGGAGAAANPGSGAEAWAAVSGPRPGVAAPRASLESGAPAGSSKDQSKASEPTGASIPTSEGVTSPIAPVHAAPAPTIVGHYRLIRVIGSGGMGTVYEAEQAQPRRLVALKVMRAGLSSGSARRRFDHESRILGRLRHPGIAQVYEAGTHRDALVELDYFAMEFIPGARTLTQFADEQRLGPRARMGLVADVCDAVHHAHLAGVVHRDLKPGNILVDAEGRPKVIDFGVAREGAAPGEPAQTNPGQLIGTLAYMSPEQCASGAEGMGAIDARSDVYALGVVLYQLLTGSLPVEIEGAGVADAVRLIREQAPRRPSAFDARLRGDPETIIQKALRKDPSQRYASAAELADDLRRCLAGEAILGRGASALYVARVGARRLASKFPRTALIACALLAAVAALEIGVPLIFDWTPADGVFQRFMTQTLPQPLPSDAFGAVRVITMTDALDPAALAAREGLEGVENDPARVTSLRRLHGRLMERLAGASPGVVAWDITFESPSDFDADFVRGVRALSDSGVPVVVGSPTCDLDARGLPRVSPAILAAARWGVFTAGLGPERPWRLDLAVARGDEEPMPSFALAALAAWRRPDVQAAVAMDEAAGTLTLRYWRPVPEDPRARARSGESDVIQLSSVNPQTSDEPDLRLMKGDRIGAYLIQVPSDAVLAGASVAYEDVLTAGAEQLRRWFAGRAVVIGDPRDTRDWHELPDGRRHPGCIAQATGLDALQRGLPLRFPREWHTWAIVGLAGLMGVAGAALAGSGGAWKGRGLALLGVLCGAWPILSILGYYGTRYLLDPLLPIVAVGVAFVLAALVQRLRAVPNL